MDFRAPDFPAFDLEAKRSDNFPGTPFRRCASEPYAIAALNSWPTFMNYYLPAGILWRGSIRDITGEMLWYTA